MIKFNPLSYRSIIIYILALLQRTLGARFILLFCACTRLLKLISGTNNSNKETAMDWPERSILPLVKMKN